MDIQITRAQPADIEEIMRLNKELFTYEYEHGFSKTYNQEWTYSDDGRKYFEKFASDENHAGWIATRDSIAVAFIIGAIGELAFRNPTTVAEIEMIYVDETCRGSGVGKRLVDEFVTWAKEKGAGILRVGALAPNEKARAFYEKYGFREAEIMYELD